MSKLPNQDGFSSNNTFANDLEWISRNITPKKYGEEQIYIEDNIDNKNIDNLILNRSLNGGSKLTENTEQNTRKREAISRLTTLNYRTPAKEISECLTIIFKVWEEKPKHWSYIAQHYTPKTIKSVIAQMIKQHRRGDNTFNNPGAYFTSIIKHRPKRKRMRNTNGNSKYRKYDKYSK